MVGGWWANKEGNSAVNKFVNIGTLLQNKDKFGEVSNYKQHGDGVG